jgi:hypothetical protein
LKQFERLEGRQLMSTVNVTDFGARPNDGGDDRGAFQAAIDAARPGDIVNIPAGTFDLNGSLRVHSGITIKGQSGGNSSHLNMNLGGGDWYGFIIDGNASNVTLDSMDMHSSRGLIRMTEGSRYTNVKITNNRFQHKGFWEVVGSSYLFGIRGTVANEGLQITGNYFHDSQDSLRSFEVWYARNAKFDHNTYFNTDDGGHIMEPQDNVSFSYNYGTKMHRMGIEIQGDTPSSGLKVVGNVFYDWVNPYYDSFGLSVVNHHAHNTLVADNYLKANIASGSGWGQPDGGGVRRFGFGIEAGGLEMNVRNNTIVGNWIGGVVVSRKNVALKDNHKWGPGNWGDYTTEPSPDGYGSILDLGGNTVDRDESHAPAPPKDTNGGDENSAAVTNVVGNVLTDTTAKLTWAFKNLDPTKVTSIRVDIRSTVGGQVFPSQTFSGHPTTATLANLHPGWQLDFTVVAITASGEVAASPVTLQMTGNAGGGGDGQHEAAVTNVTGTVISDKSAKLSWLFKDLDPATVKSVRIDIVSTVGREKFPSRTFTGNPTSVTLSPLHPGWKLDITIVAITSSGKEIKASPITLQMTGNPSLPFDPNDNGSKPEVTVSLTELPVESSTNGWGPYEKNRSNGELGANDGRTISIRGKTYAQGFGVHAPSSLVFKLNGKYKTFNSDIGLDDETAGDGSVIFQVFGDGKKLYDSGTLLGTSVVKTVNVDVTGVQELKLVVISPTSSVASDHADWANPVLIMPAFKGSASDDGGVADMNKTYLESINWKYAENQLGEPEVNQSNGGSEKGDGSILAINGRSFAKGLGVTANSLVKYRLNGKYDYFAAYIGMDDDTESRGTVAFKIVADGEVVYESDVVNNTSRARKIMVPVAGKNEVWLVVGDAQGAGNQQTHVDWAQSYLLAAA